MPRALLIRSNEFPYHVTGRCNNREEFHAQPQMVWEVFCEKLLEVSELYSAKTHAFVLMPNHFHLIMTTPREDLGIVMQKFMSSVTRTLNRMTGRSGRVFGGKYHRALIQDLNYFDIATKYLYRNPAKAKLVQKVEWYPYSTLNAVNGTNKLKFNLEPAYDFNSLIPSHSKWTEYLSWLNEPFKSEFDEKIRKNLRRKTFLLPQPRDWKRSK